MGKSTLVSGFIAVRGWAALWYPLDAADADPVRFFNRLRAAAPNRKGRPLPAYTDAYRDDARTFALNFFRVLFERYPEPVVLVFDNVQALPPGSFVLDLIARAVDATPDHALVVGISREPPPAPFARFERSGGLTAIGARELCFTVEECEILSRTTGRRGMGREQLAALHAETQGWPAGLRLMLDHDAPAGALPDGAQKVFDYFAASVFDSIEPSWQRVLLHCALLPAVSGEQARTLCADPQAHEPLATLAARNYFVTHFPDGDTYRFHPLLRTFLRQRAERVLSAAEFGGVRRHAVQMLADQGDVDAAVQVAVEGECWDALVRLLKLAAPALLRQGRHQALATWFAPLPAAVVDTDPWAAYWKARALAAEDPARAVASFEEILARFEAAGDGTGAWRAWLAIMDAIQREGCALERFDMWMERRAQLERAFPDCGPKSVKGEIATAMFCALLNRNPAHPDFAHWKRQALFTLHHLDEPLAQLTAGVALVAYQIVRGNLARASMLIWAADKLGRMLEQEPPTQLVGGILQTWQALFAHDLARAAEITEPALELMEQSGARAFDFHLRNMGMLVSLLSGDAASIRRHLDALETRRASLKGEALFHFQHFNGVYEVMQDCAPRAREWLLDALDTAAGTGILFLEIQANLTLMFFHQMTAEPDRVRHYLAVARELNGRMQSDVVDLLCRLGDAGLAYVENRTADARVLLAEALRLARKHGFDSIGFWVPGVVLAPFCVKALEENVEAAFVRKMIRRQNISVRPLPVHLDNWPWPIRLHTFGRFAVLQDDKPIEFSGKAQKKPLELLRALIALGGRGVSVARLGQTLYPDAEADSARHAAETTLYRLRKLLGEDRSLVVQDGQVTLNPDCCWVDSWAFERMLGDSEGAVDLGKALNLYRGTFLAEEEAPWVLAPRERLRSKFLRTVTRHTVALEQRGEFDEANDWYRRGVEVDPLAEEFYRLLMRNLLRANRRAEALATYQRCRDVLASVLGIEPSADTNALYRQARGETP